MPILAVTEAIQSLKQAESRLGLNRTRDPRFFPEWTENLPPLTAAEEATLDRVKASYLYNSADAPPTESTINLIVISPLLYLRGFCDPPFTIRGEMSVEVTADEGQNQLRGRIDALVLQKQLWLVLVESKQAKFSFSVAIPQALAYMMASPSQQQPTFGMVTNGDGFLFIKLIKQPQPIYALSDDFSLFAQTRNELYDVFRIMKHLGEIVTGE